MSSPSLAGTLEFLRATERLKTTYRSGFTSDGRHESVAEHTWRICMMAVVLSPQFPDVDFARLVRICIVHDLGEVIGGDVPAPEQARRLAEDPSSTKAANERRDLLTVLAPLDVAMRDEIVSLWDEYEAAATPEARLAKALDKLETILQHTQGDNPEDFDYRFNLGYGREYTAGHPVIVELRAVLDADTERRARLSDPVR
ncbi:MAG: HD domain-containing protein [Gemmatimonadaceae bacterium]|nr:HD domain-containing protein [Gemmatimonadaceae bacterium]